MAKEPETREGATAATSLEQTEEKTEAKKSTSVFTRIWNGKKSSDKVGESEDCRDQRGQDCIGSWEVKKKSPATLGGWQTRRLDLFKKTTDDGNVYGSIQYYKGNDLAGKLDTVDVKNFYADAKNATKFSVSIHGETRKFEFQASSNIMAEEIMERLVQAFPDKLAIAPDSETRESRTADGK